MRAIIILTAATYPEAPHALGEPALLARSLQGITAPARPQNGSPLGLSGARVGMTIELQDSDGDAGRRAAGATPPATTVGQSSPLKLKIFDVYDVRPQACASIFHSSPCFENV